MSHPIPTNGAGKLPTATNSSPQGSPNAATVASLHANATGRGIGGPSPPHSSSRGGRRQVHARAHARDAFVGGALRETAKDAENSTANDRQAGDGPASLPTHSRGVSLQLGEEVESSGSQDPRLRCTEETEAFTPQAEGKETPRESQAAAAPQSETTGASQALSRGSRLGSRLWDPEHHRRLIAAGSSNPLHIWGHEAAFFKSSYFSPKRRRAEKKYRSQKDQAVKMLEEHKDTPPNIWSEDSTPETLLSGKGGAGQPFLSTAGQKNNGGKKSNGADGYYYSSSISDVPQPTNPTWAAPEHCRTRNVNALRAFSWDQRVFLPQRRGMFSSVFDLFASPRFWEKIDWAFRGAVLTILPVLILCLEPTTKHIFPLPTSVVFLAYWTTQPTLGAGLRETYVVFKGFTISFILLIVVVAISPGPSWVVLLILFFALLVTGFVAEQLKRMVAYCFTSLLMQYIRNPVATNYTYIGKYYLTLVIGQGFGLASFLVPYIRWSSENARRYVVVTGDAISLSVHGACCSFWVVNSLLERQLQVARLRQLQQTVEASTKKAQQGISEMGYEPHSGVYTARLKVRLAFLKNVYNVVQSMSLVIEQIAANPALVETPMCREFGERIRPELNLAAATMDSMLLRIVDLDNVVSVNDMRDFRKAKDRYMDAVSNVRDEVILSNPDYRTDNSDILLGFFLFSVEQLLEIISNFQDAAVPPSNLWYFLTFPLRDVQSSFVAFEDLYNAVKLRRSITRRLKEAIKLSVCIIAAACFQVYALKNASTSPVAGVDIIAFVYRPTGGESFQYATLRMLGIVLGSLTGLLSVQIANGRRPVLYGCTLVLTCIGAYVQAAPEYGALGSALTNSVISIVISYSNQSAAMTRIQQNCFAILIYFIITSLIWPVRGRMKVNTGLDMSLRMAREASDRLLRNLDLPDSATSVSADVLAVLGEMQKKVTQQISNIPGAIAEPTLDSAAFPEMPWRMLVSSQRKLHVTLLMMRHAYLTFMTSTIADEAGAAQEKAKAKTVEDNANMVGMGPTAATSISVHWVVLHRISPYAVQLSQLFYEVVEVYLLTLSHAALVPTAELTRLRLGMMQCYDRIVSIYIETLQHELNESEVGEGKDDMTGVSSDDESDSSQNNDINSSKEGKGSKSTQRGDTAVRDGGAVATGTGELRTSAGFVPPAASTFAPTSTTVGGTADSPGGTRDGQLKNSFAVSSGSFGSFSAFRTGGCFRAAPSVGSFTATPNIASNAATSQKKVAGHFSYKLTPEERQRLRDYVLGPGSGAAANASFFASANALAAAAESRLAGSATAKSTPAPDTTTTANNTLVPNNNSVIASDGLQLYPSAPTHGSPSAAATDSHSAFRGHNPNESNLTNQSMFNANGTFWNRNMSMFDPAMLRNAGIVVQEPTHEQPRQHRHGTDSNASTATGALSVGHSSLRHSATPPPQSPPPQQGLGNPSRPSAYEDPLGSYHASAPAGASGATGPDPRLTGSRGDGSGLNASPSFAYGRSFFGVPGSGYSRHQPPSSSSPPPQQGSNVSRTPISADTAGIVKKSKTSKYAMPSVLQMSMVLPASAAAALLANTGLGNRDAAAQHGDDDTSLTISQSTPANNPVNLAAMPRLDPPSPSSSRDNTAAGSVGGTSHTHGPPSSSPTQAGSAAAAPLPTSTPEHPRSALNSRSFISTTASAGAASTGDVFMLGRDTRSPVHSTKHWSLSNMQAALHHRKSKSDSPREQHECVRSGSEEAVAPEDRSHMPDAQPATAKRGVPHQAGMPTDEIEMQEAREPFGTEEDKKTEKRLRKVAVLDHRHDTLPCMDSAADAPEKHKRKTSEERQGSPEKDRAEGGGGARQRQTSTLAQDSSPHFHPHSPSRGLRDATRSGSASGDRVLQHNSSIVPSRSFFVSNSSFSAGAPAIPDALRQYVESLAEQQRQQAPPPPAVMGNMSFVNVLSALPISNRSFRDICGPGGLQGTFSSPSSPPLAGAQSLSVRPPDGAAAAASAANPGPLRLPNASMIGSTSATFNAGLQADFMSAINSLEFNNGSFMPSGAAAALAAVSANRGEGGGGGGSGVDQPTASSGFLALLDPEAGDGAGEGGGGDEYVLTNSDIHSLEAFLFGLRAIITQVEQLERFLLEVVHGNDMATKL